MSTHYSHFLGALYDFDDTLMSTLPDDGNPYGLHERSRLAAIHSVAKKHDLPILLEVTDEENNLSFLEAPEHSVDAALWTVLHRRGVITGAYDPKHPLIIEMGEAKAVLHIKLLDELGVEIAGASAFVQALERHGLAGKQAIASGARPEEVQLFVTKYHLGQAFPRSRIIARGDYTRPKPDPDSFNCAFKTLGLADTPETRARVFTVEDDPRGIAAAQAAGLYVAALTTRYPAKAFEALPQPPDIIAVDFFDLAAQLKLPLNEA